ncbi:hypothetical protein MIT9_P0035 [Methylomarinovum caldicuralii]|uniref:Prepilin-type N-terminal cleavage/methylation domain-containing protein n=2 Tax=Methylomarinovum caldicuralii TaxID=438856 RepID=A0AAU9BX00_9GAMM|nr:hypothetical protein MIT9_P0035 [Methylomarinovum caldicuralii]
MKTRIEVKENQAGFTLVEIAIVLVVVGLLLGGVMKGQEIVKNAKITSLQNAVKEVSAAMLTYQDRYKALPGDDKKASEHLGIAKKFNAKGKQAGDGYIHGSWNSKKKRDESRLFWKHLRAAGLLSGSGAEQPQHAFGGKMGVQGSAWNMRGPVLCFGGIPGDVAAILDNKLDDGKADSGSVRASTKDAAYDLEKTYTPCAAL